MVASPYLRRLSRYHHRHHLSLILPILNGLNFSITRPFCQTALIDYNSPANSSSQSNVIQTLYNMVCESYNRQASKTTHFTTRAFKLNLNSNLADTLTQEQAMTVLASLAKEGGSMLALSFFYWLIDFPKFRHFMRLYIVLTMCLMKNLNFERAHEVMCCMVKNLGEVGMLKEAVYIVLDMQNQGLVLNSWTLNCILSVANEMGCVDFSEYVFDEMCERRGIRGNSCCYKSMVVAYCRSGRISDADRWLSAMLERGFLVDNATCTLILSMFCDRGWVNRALWAFYKLVGMGLSPNVIHYTCLINGLCKRGSIKQAFELLEEMVGKGLKPNVFTHTTLIDGLCKKGWTEKAFRLFLKLVRSDSYKPNVHTYTAMIAGYCKEEKMSRAEMLLSRMQEQGLVPNANTYTTLIDGYCKEGTFDRAYDIMDRMVEGGLTPGICTYNTLIDGLCKKGRVTEAYKVLKRSFRNGLSPDKFTYTILLSESCKYADGIREALALFNKMVKAGITPDIYVYTTLIGSLCRQNRMKESQSLFDDAVNHGLIPTTETYTCMLCGYCRDGNTSMAVKLFHRMSRHGCSPDSFAYGALISGLCKESKLNEARILFDMMLDNGLSPCEVTRLTIAYEFCKKEDSSTAMALLDKLDKKQWTHTVNSLVRKLCSEKKVDIATVFFQKLLDVNHHVDRIPLAAFMSACYNSNKYALVADMSEKIAQGTA